MSIIAETERPFDGQLCHKYVYQNLLKLYNPSSSYGKKILCIFMPHTVYILDFIMDTLYCLGLAF